MIGLRPGAAAGGRQPGLFRYNRFVVAALNILDVRAEMPRRGSAPPQPRQGLVTGLAVHHSAMVNPATGLSTATAQAIFQDQVSRAGWDHGAYHYLIRPNGLIEYALDEAVPAYHAGFVDPDDRLGRERGQYWNEHYLAVCLLGWFDSGRQVRGEDGPQAVPDFFTHPPAAQWRALLDLIQVLRVRHRLPAESIRGHRELAGCQTRCPGDNLNLEALRAALRAA
jgi:N-acetyl-anhydromuramyl-L-alanine amidase AmpD